MRNYLSRYILIFLSCLMLLESCQLPNINTLGKDNKFDSKTIQCDSWYVRSFNNDNSQSLSVNGQQVFYVDGEGKPQFPYVDSGLIDIGSYLTFGSNTVSFQTVNFHNGSPHSWGYEVYKNGERVFNDVGGVNSAPDGQTHTNSYTINVNSSSEICINKRNLEKECQQGNLEACDILKEKNNPTLRPSPRPSQAPSNSCGDGKSISPFSFKGLSTQSFSTKGLREDNILETMNHLIDVLQRIKVYQEQYDSYNQSGDTAKRDEVNVDLQKYIQEKNEIAPDILSGLNNYKTSLRNQVNTLMEDNTFSVDDSYKPVDLLDYQDNISDWDYMFDIFIKNQNTYSLIQSKSILADQIQLLSQLTDDIINNRITDIEHNSNQNITNNDDIYSLNSQFQVLKYLSNKVSFNRDKINIEIIKIKENMDDYLIEFLILNIKNTIYVNALMVGMGVVDPVTLKLTNKGFQIKDTSSEYFNGEKFWNYLVSKDNRDYIKKSTKELWNDTKRAGKEGINTLINVLDRALSIPDQLSKPVYEFALKNAPGGNKLTSEQISDSADKIVTGVGMASMFINPKELGHLILNPKKLLDLKPSLLATKEMLERAIKDAIEGGDFQKAKELGKDKKNIDNALKEADKLENKLVDETIEACKVGKIKQTFKKLDDVLTDPKLKEYRKRHDIPEDSLLGEIKYSPSNIDKNIEKLLNDKSNNVGKWEKFGKEIIYPTNKGVNEVHYFKNNTTGEIFDPKGVYRKRG